MGVRFVGRRDSVYRGGVQYGGMGCKRSNSFILNLSSPSEF